MDTLIEQVNEKYMSVTDAARELGHSHVTLWRWIQGKQLAAEHLGRAVLVLKCDVARIKADEAALQKVTPAAAHEAAVAMGKRGAHAIGRGEGAELQPGQGGILSRYGRQERPCQHRWLLGPQVKGQVEGECKNCGEAKTFTPTIVEDWNHRPSVGIGPLTGYKI